MVPQSHRTRPEGLRRDELATLAVVTKGWTLSTYLSTLRAQGAVLEQHGQVHITPIGEQLLEGAAPRTVLTPPEVAALHHPKLRAGAKRMLDVLMRAPEQGFTRTELAGLSGVTRGGTVSTYLSTLRARGLVVERADRAYPSPTLYLGTRTADEHDTATASTGTSR